MQKDNPKILNAWCSFDWANSAYNLIVTSTLFPSFYEASTKAAYKTDMLPIFGFSVKNTVLYTFVISLSYFIISILSPILSGLADYSGKRKRFMQFFTYLGSFSCLMLFFFTGDNFIFGLFFALLASIGYAGSLVFYNSFLPAICSPSKMDQISARGFASGYIGSVLLLIVNLIMLFNAEKLGFSTEFALRLAFLMVGLWWIIFAQIAFYHLQDEVKEVDKNINPIYKGFEEIKKTFHNINSQQNLRRFLASFFFYSMGVQTIMLLAPLFGQVELKMESSELILIILILQIVAILGAIIFARISKMIGNKATLSVTIGLWIVICWAAYSVQTITQFYILSACVGLVMGSIQSMSRSTYAKIVPEDTPDTASYFSFYDVTEKVAIVIGTFSYGLIETLTQSMRYSALGLSIYFIVGLFFMFRFKDIIDEKRTA